MKYLVFDISNMLYRTFFVQKNEDDMTQAGLAHHTALTTLNKYYKGFKPHKVVMAFDRPSWRKEYTTNQKPFGLGECVSGRVYKGGRRKSMTPAQREKYERFMDHISEFEDMMRRHTSVICLMGEGLEADDLIAGFVQKHYGTEDEIIVVSADRDYLQLLRGDNIKLISPENGKELTLEEWDNDPDLFVFEKMFRGEGPQKDNVMGAYPGVRKKKIREAYYDSFACVNLMNEFWTDPEGKEFLVKRVFEENKLLMDLSCQPKEIRDRVNEIIEQEMADPGKYSYFHFLRFCGKYELKKISEHAELFVPMLSR